MAAPDEQIGENVSGEELSQEEADEEQQVEGVSEKASEAVSSIN